MSRRRTSLRAVVLRTLLAVGASCLALVTFASASPAAFRVAYTTPGALWLANLDGSNAVQIASGWQDYNGPRTPIQPSLSPDNERVVYVDACVTIGCGPANTYMRIAPGNDFVGWCCDRLYWQDPTWSTNGRDIYYSQSASNNRVVFALLSRHADGTTQPDGSPDQLLTPYGNGPNQVWSGAQRHPAASSTGTVAFDSNTEYTSDVAYSNGATHIYVMSGPRGALRDLGEGARPTFSPDASRLAFQRTPKAGSPTQVYVVTIASGAVTRLTSNTATDSAPSWSPSNQIFFNRKTSKGVCSLWAMNPDGSSQRQVTSAVSKCDGTAVPFSTALGPDDGLAQKFMPDLRFDSAERFRPLDVDQFARERNPDGTPMHQVCDDAQGCAPLTSLAGLASRIGPNAHIDIGGTGDTLNTFAAPGCSPDATVLDCESAETALYYGFVGPSPAGYRYINYGFFYRFNKSYDVYGDHEGDWEGVTIAPSLYYDTFDFVIFNQHKGRNVYLRENLRCDGGPVGSCGNDLNEKGHHVTGYVADGTHATYAAPCSSNCTQTSEEDGVNLTPEKSHDGEAAWNRNTSQALSSGALLRFPAPLPDTVPWGAPGSASGWTDWPGRWGSTVPGSVIPGEPSPESPAAGGHRSTYLQPWVGTTCADKWCSAPARARRPLDGCAEWFGPGVGVLACRPAALTRAIRGGRVGHRGPFSLSVSEARTSASGAGLAQVMARPLAARSRIDVRGSVPAGTLLFLRIRAETGAREVVFRLPPIHGHAVLEVAKGASGPRLRVGGRTLRPVRGRGAGS